MDKHDLYEICVQRPEQTIRLLSDLHGRNPAALAEDFCGSAAVSREWVRSDPDRSAVGIDADPDVLRIAERKAAPLAGDRRRLQLLLARLGASADPAPSGRSADFDVVYAGNFSIGELRQRSDLLGYLRFAHDRLRKSGIVACDTYGGRTAFVPGTLVRTIVVEPEPGIGTSPRIIRYAYEQVSADPFTGLVENHLHFDVIRNGELEARWRSAFVYRWRLWSVPELRDALLEAGFESTRVVWRLDHTTDCTEQQGAIAPPETFAALVVGTR